MNVTSNSMSKFLRLIKTLRKDISVLFIICIVTIFAIDFWLKGIPEFFNGGAKIGDIVYKLCMSYISAFIFYFLVVHIKAQKDNENLYAYVTKKVYMVIGSCLGLINEMAKASNITLNDRYPNDVELTTICKSIDPHANAPLLLGGIGNYANWIQYIDYQKKRSIASTAKIFAKMPFLDTTLVRLLTNIEDSSHFMVMDGMVQMMPLRNQDLTSFQKTMADYFVSVKALEDYAENKLKSFK